MKKAGQTSSEDVLKTMVRLDLQRRLLSYEKDLHDFDLEPMTDEEKSTVEEQIEDPLICDEKDYDVDELRTDVAVTLTKFTETQQEIFNIIMHAVQQKESLQLFISARGGYGKTFRVNAVLKVVRSLESDGCVALAMGTTRISSISTDC